METESTRRFKIITKSGQWRIGDVFYLSGRGDLKWYIQEFVFHTLVNKWYVEASFTKEYPKNQIDLMMCEADDGLLKEPENLK